MSDAQEVIDKLYGKFQNDAHDIIHAEKESNRLYDSGQPRSSLRSIVYELGKTADVRLEYSDQVKFYMFLASDFYGFQEYELAMDCFDLALSRCDYITNDFDLIKNKVEAIQSIVKSAFGEIMQLLFLAIAPMSVSKLLLCLKQLRESIDHVFDLPVKNQEELAWLILNSCKLILEIGQPLTWLCCGRYVIETMMFAATSMEAVINLCTVRHMKFRMKLYSTTFYAALSQGSRDESIALLAHAKKQVFELKEREELDPPVPERSRVCILRNERDLAVMDFVLSFWSDPDSFRLTKDHLDPFYKEGETEETRGLFENKSFLENCVCECIRVHLLSSGNVNETFRKRSACILKGMETLLSDYTPLEAPLESPEDENKDPNEVPQSKWVRMFTLGTVVEVMKIALFEVSEGVEVPSLFSKLNILAAELSEHNTQHHGGNFDTGSRTTAASTHRNMSGSAVEEWDIMVLLSKVLGITDQDAASDERYENLKFLSEEINKLLYTTVSYRRKSFIIRTVLCMWNKFLHPPLQATLSEYQHQTDVDPALQRVLPGFLVLVKSLDLVSLEDPLLSGSIAIITAKLHWHLEDHRGAITLLRQTLTSIEEHRAARVDAAQHIPEDVRDIYALQRSSFTTRSEAFDWFHSVKRLGAHAFAGYGIFGLSSSVDRVDQALAELHTDMLSLYFRFELQYCWLQFNKKRFILNVIKREREKNAQASADMMAGKVGAIKKMKNIEKMQKTKKKTLKSTTVAGTNITNIATLLDTSSAEVELNAELLSIFPSLRVFCAKNSYFRCLLLLEMARVDSDPIRKHHYLMEAVKAVEESEGREHVLKQSFTNLIVLTEEARRHPLIIARSHRFIYVVPVGCRKDRKASYYRVLGKEKGSGTDVSIYNDDLGGCDRRVYLSEMQSMKNSVVKIGPLRNGEHYVFGSVAFSTENKQAGQVSPSTPVVEALNPLPTVLLWTLITQVASDIDDQEVMRVSSARVCDRYFQVTPKPNVRTVGKGFNLFLFPEPSLCMLALQQTSPVLLQYFVSSFLNYEQLYLDEHLHNQGGAEEGDDKPHWTMRKGKQVSALISLSRTALVSGIACAMGNLDLTVRCVQLGYQTACELIAFDLTPMAHYLQNPLLTLILALQNIPKSRWWVVEHQLYCRLLAYVAKFAAIRGNITPVISLLKSFYPEAVAPPDAEEESSGEGTKNDHPPERVFPDYLSMFHTVCSVISSQQLVEFIAQMKALFPVPSVAEYDEKLSKQREEEQKRLQEQTVEGESPPPPQPPVGYFWSLSPLQREVMLNNMALELSSAPSEEKGSTVTPERLQWEKWLRQELPVQMSDYLSAMVQMGKELYFREKLVELKRFLLRMPVYREFVTMTLHKLMTDWGVPLLRNKISSETVGSKNASPRGGAKRSGSAKGGKAKGKASAVPEVEPAEIPDRFITCDAEEEVLQFQSIGEILLLLASACSTTPGSLVQHHPSSTKGPKMEIDPYHFTPSIEQNPPGTQLPVEAIAKDGNSETGDVAARDPLDRLANGPVSLVDQVRMLGAAMCLFAESGAVPVGVAVVVRLWNIITSLYLDPEQFLQAFNNIRPLLHKILVTVVKLFECSCYNQDAPSLAGSSEAGSADHTMPLVAEEGIGMSIGFGLLEEEQNAEDFSALYRRETKENVLLMRDMIIYLMKVEWLMKDYLPELVRLGSNVMNMFLQNAKEFCKDYGDSCLPLIKQSQEWLVEKAQKDTTGRQKDLEQFVFQYEEAQRKSRKKKPRIARLEKDEDELLFEAERAVYEEKVKEAAGVLKDAEERLAIVLQQQRKFDKMFSGGSQALDKLRKSLRIFLAEMKDSFGLSSEVSYPDLLVDNAAVSERMEHLLQQCSQTVNFLREKKERLLLIQALKEQGDLLLLFGQITHARRVWHDLVDGIFNTMDACANWKEVADFALSSLDADLIPGILPTVITLAKLSKYCSSNNWDKKAGYCRMAAQLCRIPFQESVGHPITLAGFAAYECYDLGGLHALGATPEELSHKGLPEALEEISSVLLQEMQFAASFPVVVLWEHFTGVYTRNATHFLTARLFRVRLLIRAHFFAEAASMLAGIPSRLENIHNHTFTDRSRRYYSKVSADLARFEATEGGLSFFGYSTYRNNLPPDENTNVLALKWIQAFPDEFTELSKKYVTEIPLYALSEEEQAKAKAQAAEKVAEAVNSPKKGKGAKPGKTSPRTETEAAETEPTSLTIPLFPTTLLAEIRQVCGLFMMELAMLDDRSTADNSSTALKNIGEDAKQALKRTTEVLFDLLPKPKVLEEVTPKGKKGATKPDARAASPPLSGRNPGFEPGSLNDPQVLKLISSRDWLRCYARCQLLLSKYSIHQREFRGARATLENFQRLLRSEKLSALSAETSSAVVPLWMESRNQLITLAHKQARFSDALELINEANREATALACGTWYRANLMEQSKIFFKLGEISKALQSCENCLRHFESNKLENMSFVQCLVLQVTILRERMATTPVNTISPSNAAAFGAVEILTLNRRAVSIASRLAMVSGAFPADSNVTFGRADTTVSDHHLVAPLLHNLTQIHNNEPPLTLHPSFDPKKLDQLGIRLPLTTAKVLEPVDPFVKSHDISLQALRLGPIDEDEVTYLSSEFSNVYLIENRVLLASQVALMQVILDMKSSGFLDEGNGDHNYSTAINNLLEKHSNNSKNLLQEQLVTGESSLKLMRHCLYCPTNLRVSALALTGSARLARGSKLKDGANSADAANFQQMLFGPARAALLLATKTENTCLWDMMRFICVQLLESLGDTGAELGFDPENNGSLRLKLAILYLTTAIKLRNQEDTLRHHAIELSEDPSFAALPEGQLKSLVQGISSSSVTPKEGESHADEAVAAPAKGKGKPAKGAAPVAIEGLTGRDALLVLSTLLKEASPLWLLESEHGVISDLHKLIMKEYPVYKAKCCLAAPPSPNDNVFVTAGSVATLFLANKKPAGFSAVLQNPPNELDYSQTGWYSHVAVYFLLGDAVATTALVEKPVSAGKKQKTSSKRRSSYSYCDSIQATGVDKVGASSD